MCGRYLVITEDEIIEMKSILEELNQRFSDMGGFAMKEEDPLFGNAPQGFHALETDASGDRFLVGEQPEAAPSLVAPVMVVERDKCILKPMKWGFPQWNGKGSIINAKAETIEEKTVFRDSFLHHRCIIPSRGFFEWKKPSSAPLLDLLSPLQQCPLPGKYWIRREDSPLFFMAGIYQKSPCFEEFVILTMPANLQIAPIHDRMPVSLDRPQLLPWLQDPSVLQFLLQQNQTSPVPFLLSHVHSGERTMP